VKSTVRKSIRLGLVAGLAVTGLVGVTSLTASGTGNGSMVGYGTLRINFDTTSTPSTGSVTYTPPSGSGQPVLTQPIVTVQPCNTIAFEPITTNGTDEIPGNLLHVTPQAVGNGVASDAGSVQLTKIGAGVQISGNDCGDPSGQIGPGEQMTLALGSYFDPAVVARSAALQIGKRQANDGSLTIAFDAAANGATRTEVSIATGGQRVTVKDGNGDFRIISLRSTARQQSRGLSLLSTTEINLEAPADPTAPGAPTIGTADSTNPEQATVRWTAPNDGGSPITGYTVEQSANGGPWTAANIDPATGTTTTRTVTGLTNGIPYTFRVAAVNAVGTGNFSSASNSVTPVGAPGAPTIGTADSTNPEQATVRWTAPNDGGSPITGYTVEQSANGGPWTAANIDPATGTTTTRTVTGLTNGIPYTFRVAAVNAVGTGNFSSASNSVTPVGAPGAPTIGTADSTNPEQATVRWTAPNDGGSPITGYTVEQSANGGPWTAANIDPATGTTTTRTVTGLTNGIPYTFRVAAVNAVGTGNFSSASNSVTPVGAPGAPTIGTADSTNPEQATVRWTAPNDGGSPITGYTVEQSANGGPWTAANIDPATGTTTTRTVTGLTNGIPYTFRVAAVNAVGTGAPSQPSNPVTPGSELVGCTDQIFKDGSVQNGDIAKRVEFFRGENDPDKQEDVECADVGATIDIVNVDIAPDGIAATDFVFFDNAEIGVDQTVQRVNATVMIEWAPAAASTAGTPTRIDYDGYGPGGFTDVLWCKSYTRTVTNGKVTFDAELPMLPAGTAGANENGTAPWCLVSRNEVIQGNQAFRTELYFGSGDPGLTKLK
jgi:hypothetical protein